MPRGEVYPIIGNMFADKSGELIRRIETLHEYGRKRVIVFKPDTDTRSEPNQIKSQGSRGEIMAALEISATNPAEMLTVIATEEAKQGASFHAVAVDEIQFFDREKFYATAAALLRRNYDLIVAGIPLDFRGEPFGATLDIVGLCLDKHHCTWLNSFCVKCGQIALYPQRMIDDKPAPYDSPQILVGGSRGRERYEARCHDCFELPGRPSVS